MSQPIHVKLHLRKQELHAGSYMSLAILCQYKLLLELHEIM